MATTATVTDDSLSGLPSVILDGQNTSGRISWDIGRPEPIANNTVKATRITIYANNKTIYVSSGSMTAVGNGTSGQITATSATLDADRKWVALYNDAPRSYNFSGSTLYEDWDYYFYIKSMSGVYGAETVNFTVEYLKKDGSVYASKTRSVKIYTARTIEDVSPPAGPPTNVVAQPISSQKVKLTWEATDRTTACKIQKQSYNGSVWSAWSDVTTVGGNGSMTYTVEGLTALTLYNFQIRCENDYGTTGYTASGSVRTLAVPVLPAAPTLKSVVPTAFNTVVVDFSTVPEISNGAGGFYPNDYVVLWRKTSDPNEDQYYDRDFFDSATTRVEITGLDAETQYAFVVAAHNEAGYGPTGNVVNVTTPINPNLPTAPTNFTVTTQNYIEQVLTWTQANPSNILGTFVYYCTDGVSYVPYQVAALAPNVTTFTATGLSPATTYYWAVFTYNNYQGTGHFSTPVTDSEATGTPPADPDTPTLDSVASLNNSTVILNWTAGTNNTQLGFILYRGVTTGVYTEIARVPASATSYTDTGLSANSRYFYAIKADGWVNDSAYSNEISVTTLVNTGEVNYVSGFTLHEDSRNRIIEAGGRAIITSDLDRWIVRDELGNYFKAGIRPVRGTIGIAKTTGGVLENGVYSAYIVLCRGDKTRSVPSTPSATVTINSSSRTLVVTPPLNDAGTEVECRDTGFDVFGNAITGADAWEIYLAEQNQGQAFRVARLPMTVTSWEDTPGSGTYTIDNTLDLNDIFGGTRRPMEVQAESSLPPACWEAEVRDNRVYACGEVDLEPTAAEVTAGATLVVSGGNKYFDLTDWDATDACLYHRLIINGLDTGWEIYDYDYDAVDTDAVTRCYIRHSDPAVNEAGFEGAGGSFVDFKLAGNPNRVYTSAYFSGEALSQTTYSPETFPPLCIYEGEFFPEDNTSPNGMIASGGFLLVGKPDKWVMASGGDEPDFPILTTRPLSRGSGLNAPFSMARDENDVVYYLGDTGPYRVSPGGVEKVNIVFGNQRLFVEAFDPASLADARGEWFSRCGWYVVVGLNRIGSTGNRDGFVLDVKNGAIMPFTTPLPVTCIKEFKSNSGEFQLMIGTTNARIGYLFKNGLYVDNMDYSLSYPGLYAQAIDPYLVTGVLDTEHAITPREIQPRVKTMPYNADFEFKLEIDGKRRVSDPLVFDPQKTVLFRASRVSDHVSLPSARYQQMQFRFSGKTLLDQPNAYYEIKELPVVVVVRNAS